MATDDIDKIYEKYPDEYDEYLDDRDAVINFDEYNEESVFLGEYPFEVILEGITSQFENYIGTEDSTNYVEVFYTQYHNSMDTLNGDDVDNPDLKKEILDRRLDEFTTKMAELFENRLNISIADIEKDDLNIDKIEYIIMTLYDYFIINARKNLMTVISKDIGSKINTIIEDNRQLMNTINDMMRFYSPLIIDLSAMEFLRYTGNKDVIELYDNCEFVGNFLMKYSPKLYQFPDYEVEIVSQIVSILELKEEMKHGSEI